MPKKILALLEPIQRVGCVLIGLMSLATVVLIGLALAHYVPWWMPIIALLLIFAFFGAEGYIEGILGRRPAPETADENQA